MQSYNDYLFSTMVQQSISGVTPSRTPRQLFLPQSLTSVKIVCISPHQKCGDMLREPLHPTRASRRVKHKPAALEGIVNEHRILFSFLFSPLSLASLSLFRKKGEEEQCVFFFPGPSFIRALELRKSRYATD